MKITPTNFREKITKLFHVISLLFYVFSLLVLKWIQESKVKVVGKEFKKAETEGLKFVQHETITGETDTVFILFSYHVIWYIFIIL